MEQYLRYIPELFSWVFCYSDIFLFRVNWGVRIIHSDWNSYLMS